MDENSAREEELCKPAQAVKAQSPRRQKAVPPQQDKALLRCDQEVAAVGIRCLHQLEQLNTITELTRPQQLASGLDEIPDPPSWAFSLSVHVCTCSWIPLPPYLIKWGTLLFQLNLIFLTLKNQRSLENSYKFKRKSQKCHRAIPAALDTLRDPTEPGEW